MKTPTADTHAVTPAGAAFLRGAVREGVARWRSAPRDRSIVPASAAAKDVDAPGVLGSLPRRDFLETRIPESAAPPPLRLAAPRASRVRALARLPVWLAVLLRLGLGIVGDQITRRNTVARRAERLRVTLERAGGTFAKIGQISAMRADLVPWVYAVELSRMLDRVPPFPVAHAIAAVETSVGGPLSETFDQFDPDPIGSTSLSCTYQAILRGGEKVVVKVLRAGVRNLLLADLLVVDWLAAVVEFFTILRPGSTSRIRQELRETLLDEIDFVREAREQDLFRRTARDAGHRFFTAPRVYFELSGREVIVQEFVAGMWLWELLAAVEQRHEPVLALARELDIDPAVVARRLVWVSFWSWHENLFFLANPHPDNVILSAHGRLTFIDFTSTGAVDRTMRRALHQNMLYAERGDPLNMARASLALLEPLPPLDVLELTKELEDVNWQQLYVFASRPGARAANDRSSAVQWLGFISVARKYNITVESSVLRLLRATVLFETTAMRLDPSLDILKRYRQFTRWRARRAANRLERRLTGGAGALFDNTTFLRLEQIANTGLGLFFRMRHGLTMPRVSFHALMSKGSFIVATLARLATQVVVSTLVLTQGLVLLEAWRGIAVSYGDALGMVVRANLYVALLLLLVFFNGRALLFRLDDRDA